MYNLIYIGLYLCLVGAITAVIEFVIEYMRVNHIKKTLLEPTHNFDFLNDSSKEYITCLENLLDKVKNHPLGFIYTQNLRAILECSINDEINLVKQYSKDKKIAYFDFLLKHTISDFKILPQDIRRSSCMMYTS